MKDIKEEKGLITIEASLSFVIFMFLLLFIYSFSNVYIAQNMISHATIQANQIVAIESYGRQKLSETQVHQDAQSVVGSINSIANTLFVSKEDKGKINLKPFDNFESLDKADLKNVYKKAWFEALSNQTILNKQNDYKEKLMSVGVDTESIHFDVELVAASDGGTDIVTTVTYDLYLKFPFMGQEKLETITKQSKSHLFQNVNNKRSVSWTGID